MLPHVDLLIDLSALDHKDRLREAERARIVNHAKAATTPPLPDSESTTQRPRSWLARMLLNLRSSPHSTPQPRAQPH